jgi:hypothetical protein
MADKTPHLVPEPPPHPLNGTQAEVDAHKANEHKKHHPHEDHVIPTPSTGTTFVNPGGAVGTGR